MTRRAIIAAAIALFPAIAASDTSPWATSVYNYSPGALQAQSGTSNMFSDPTQALGEFDLGARPSTPSTNVVQLGQAGSITLGFDHSILNNAADAGNAGNPLGYDFTVFGNSFKAGNSYYREPGFVEVAQKQADGSPGTFYLLLSPDKSPANMVANVDTGTGSTLLAGYADEHPVDGSGDPTLSPEVAGSAQGDGFKLEWAVEEGTAGVPLLDGNGQPIFVSLSSVDFIRITDVLPNDFQNPTGFITTDVDAVIDLPGTVPEPTAIALASPAVVMLLRRRRR